MPDWIFDVLKVFPSPTAPKSAMEARLLEAGAGLSAAPKAIGSDQEINDTARRLRKVRLNEYMAGYCGLLFQKSAVSRFNINGLSLS